MYLHYIGNGTYTIHAFEREARKYGVSRAFPAKLLKHFKWGDRILLAVWERDTSKQDKLGRAVIFGYFYITGLRYVGEGLAEEVHKDPRLRVIEVVNSTEVVSRGCGSYTVGGYSVVTNSLEELVEIVEEAAKRKGIPYKLFLEGEYVPLQCRVILEDVKFSRGLVKVDLDLPLGATSVKEPFLVYSYNYQKRRYEPKLAGVLPLDQFRGEE